MTDGIGVLLCNNIHNELWQRLGNVLSLILVVETGIVGSLNIDHAIIFLMVTLGYLANISMHIDSSYKVTRFCFHLLSAHSLNVVKSSLSKISPSQNSLD